MKMCTADKKSINIIKNKKSLSKDKFIVYNKMETSTLFTEYQIQGKKAESGNGENNRRNRHDDVQ